MELMILDLCIMAIYASSTSSKRMKIEKFFVALQQISFNVCLIHHMTFALSASNFPNFATFNQVTNY